MSFIPQAQIEDRAAALWQRYQLTPGFDVERVLDHLGLSLLWEAVSDDNGRILGQLIPEQRVVVLNEHHLGALEAKNGRLRRYTIGHEVGHWDLHAEAARSGALRLLPGGRTWCRDGSRDPVERQAELYSAALLIPHDHLCAALPKQPWHGWPTVYRLADLFVVNVTPMKIRLEQLGWAHLNENGIPVAGPKPTSGQARLFAE
jgi:Zn-dependent peptidase ImmA (M78 family)